MPLPGSSCGPIVPNLNPRTEYSPPTRKRSVSGTHSVLFLAINSSRLFEQFLSSGKIWPASALTLNELRRERRKNFVVVRTGFSAWTVPPSGPPLNPAVKLKRNPRVVSYGLSRESKPYDGAIVDVVNR